MNFVDGQESRRYEGKMVKTKATNGEVCWGKCSASLEEPVSSFRKLNRSRFRGNRNYKNLVAFAMASKS